VSSKKNESRPIVDLYSRYAETFDRLRPLKIETYRFYQQLALDFVPFDVSAIDI